MSRGLSPIPLPPARAYRRLYARYGAQGWWPTTPRGAEVPRYHPGRGAPVSERDRAEICVGAVLAQNTNWSNAEKALGALHSAGVWTLGDVERTAERSLAGLIRSSGYFRQKAKKLKAFARHAASRGKTLGRWLSGPLPELRRELLDLWGVGPETADSILLYAGGRPAFVVDAYTRRQAARLGWLRRPDYARTQDYLVRRLPKSVRLYNEFHALVVRLAKEHCRAKPVCGGCPLLDGCRYGSRLRKRETFLKAYSSPLVPGAI
ncbi:MAG: hypothetical protein KGL04_10520 [Elusimicrobia bacterium]|nr:hypothetical protein [Elusimicrobiota bacterium]